MLFFRVTVESFKKIGPSQCHNCQRYGHGSQNCGYSARCVKCGQNHSTKDCTKTREENPTCFNCGNSHTANYRGCPWYQHVLEISKPNSPNPKNHITDPPLDTPPAQSAQTTKKPPQPASKSYADVVSARQNPPPKPANSINISKVLNMLKELLAAISSSENSQEIMTKTISAFISLLIQNDE
jgi:hypothetical protein